VAGSSLPYATFSSWTLLWVLRHLSFVNFCFLTPRALPFEDSFSPPILQDDSGLGGTDLLISFRKNTRPVLAPGLSYRVPSFFFSPDRYDYQATPLSRFHSPDPPVYGHFFLWSPNHLSLDFLPERLSLVESFAGPPTSFPLPKVSSCAISFSFCVYLFCTPSF